jgi:hypothetical protein
VVGDPHATNTNAAHNHSRLSFTRDKPS